MRGDDLSELDVLGLLAGTIRPGHIFRRRMLTFLALGPQQHAIAVSDLATMSAPYSHHHRDNHFGPFPIPEDKWEWLSEELYFKPQGLFYHGLVFHAAAVTNVYTFSQKPVADSFLAEFGVETPRLGVFSLGADSKDISASQTK
jgi:hypothetical protein